MILYIWINILSIAVVVFIMLSIFNNIIKEQQLELLSALTAAKDDYTYGHELHTEALVRLFWKHLPKEIKCRIKKKILFRAAKIHDVGKVLIDTAILCKPNKLTPEEYAQIKLHAPLGAKIISRTHHHKLASIIAFHHEKWDGTGYCSAISGKDIPIEARILAIADVFSACTTPRIYQPKIKTIPEALDLLREGRGTHFDAELVDYFVEIDMSELMRIDTMIRDRYHVVT